MDIQHMTKYAQITRALEPPSSTKRPQRECTGYFVLTPVHLLKERGFATSYSGGMKNGLDGMSTRPFLSNI